MNETATTAPFVSEFVIRLLTFGPTLCDARPRDATTTAELRRAWGVHGECIRTTWLAHGPWLQAAAAERGITPRWPGGKFFSEAMAGGPKGTMR